jgi:hypothetical protein
VKAAIFNQLKMYPQMTLTDLYKSFFQDRFGPGHLISDTAAVAAYLTNELQFADNFSPVLYEPCGWQGNFVRVNISAVKNRKIPAHKLLDAFVRSANNTKMPDIDEWRSEWSRIDGIIRQLRLNLPDESADRLKISDLLDSGNYAAHHSAVFNQLYYPHYRIVEKSIFESELLPLIK